MSLSTSSAPWFIINVSPTYRSWTLSQLLRFIFTQYDICNCILLHCTTSLLPSVNITVSCCTGNLSGWSLNIDFPHTTLSCHFVINAENQHQTCQEEHVLSHAIFLYCSTFMFPYSFTGSSPRGASVHEPFQNKHRGVLILFELYWTRQQLKLYCLPYFRLN